MKKKPRQGRRGFGTCANGSAETELCEHTPPPPDEQEASDHVGAEFGLPPLPEEGGDDG